MGGQTDSPSARKFTQVAKVVISRIQLTCDQLVSTCVGWPNGKNVRRPEYEFELDQSQRKSLQETLCFTFTSSSSALLGRPRCGLWIWLSLLAIFDTLFWIEVKKIFAFVRPDGIRTHPPRAGAILYWLSYEVYTGAGQVRVQFIPVIWREWCEMYVIKIIWVNFR